MKCDVFCTCFKQVSAHNVSEWLLLQMAQDQMIGIVYTLRQLPIIWAQKYEELRGAVMSWLQHQTKTLFVGSPRASVRLAQNVGTSATVAFYLAPPNPPRHGSSLLLCAIPSQDLFLLIWNRAVSVYKLLDGDVMWTTSLSCITLNSHVRGHVPLRVTLPSNSRKAIIALPFRKDLGFQYMDSFSFMGIWRAALL